MKKFVGVLLRFEDFGKRAGDRDSRVVWRLYETLDVGPIMLTVNLIARRRNRMSHSPPFEYPHIQSTGHGIPAFRRTADRTALLAQGGGRPAAVLRGWIDLARCFGPGLLMGHEWGLRSENS
jgi:hypothetical protein